jgi:hypothetical protein
MGLNRKDHPGIKIENKRNTQEIVQFSDGFSPSHMFTELLHKCQEGNDAWRSS